MARFAQYDYLFAFSLIFAFLDAYGIGANDVANSFATSVSSRSLTFRQAMLAAAVCEFLGAVLVGARVASTIKNGIISLSVFHNDPEVLLLAFTCAIVGSATWLTFATRHAMPVSTTHTTVGSVIGIGIAAGGPSAVKWGWDGVGQIFASWGIAPCIAGGFASIVYLITKYVVLRSKNPVKMGLITAPVYFFIVSAILTMSILWKGSPSLNLDELPTSTLVAAIIGTGAVIAALSILFWLPYVYCHVVRGDYTVKWYHFFLGPLLWRRTPPADASAFTADRAVPDYYAGHREEDHVPATVASDDIEARANDKTPGETDELSQKGSSESPATKVPHPSKLAAEVENNDLAGRPPPPNYRTFDGSWMEPWNMYTVLRYNALPWAWYCLSAGLRTDIHKMQMSGTDKEQERIKAIHSRAAQYDNKVEHLFSFMQVMTACTASFAHGANDVSNAIGPLSVVYGVWSTSEFPSSKASVPIWILVFGGAAIVIGLGTYGWRLMSVLGNRLTLHSPSRGFSMELGASITVVLASQLSIPVSSTQSITGATVAVALCNGDWRAMNWKMLCWIFFSWCLTLPIAGTISGCLLGIILNAPRWS